MNWHDLTSLQGHHAATAFNYEAADEPNQRAEGPTDGPSQRMSVGELHCESVLAAVALTGKPGRCKARHWGGDAGMLGRGCWGGGGRFSGMKGSGNGGT